MGTRLTMPTPGDYLLRRDVCSYGYFLLAPNHWDPRTETLTRSLDLSGGIAAVRIGQPGRGKALVIEGDRRLSRGEQAEVKRLVTRMLHLNDVSVGAFHKVDGRWKKSGRGRLFRSPTFFEDLIKTVASCNVTWPSTIVMNRRLCEVISPAFPSAQQLARRREATLRARCRVGYRDKRMVELGKLVAGGEVEPAWFEDRGNSDEAVYKALLALPGIGPYAAANVMQLLGRYSRVAIDTESVRHGKAVLGMTGTAKQIEKQVVAHFEPFGEHRFRSYWFELWDFYEKKHGPAWTWERDSTGKMFTAASLTKE
ncbi:MAG: hypothetical protein H6812_11960 [Phycisphaeraceae bacterium]|nr:hypothetical protein [Phycisphaerales bacterium]MCB9843953.1 hypothetical protein [Phycisphaeraceae bacterium]